MHPESTVTSTGGFADFASIEDDPEFMKLRSLDNQGRSSDLKEVTINKEEAIKRLTENRAKHRKIFEEAVEGFKKRAEEALSDTLERVQKGKIEAVQVYLPRPVDHTKDYDREITMLQLSVDDTVTLSQADFASFVMDDWAWRREFVTTNAAYSETAAAALSDYAE